MTAGQPKSLRYGEGSPFKDIQLPCGGGLDILPVPRHNPSALRRVLEHRRARRNCRMQIDGISGQFDIIPEGETGRQGDTLKVRMLPEVRF